MGCAIRTANLDDVAALTEIYNHYIVHTHFTFDVDPFSVADRKANWFAQFSSSGRHRLLIATDPVQNDSILGYASSTSFKAKRAYETSVEFTIYLNPVTQTTESAHRRGVGRALYSALIAALKGEDVHRAYAGVAQPNEPSMRFHQQLGFETVGTYQEVGRKFGKYWDVTWLQRPLG